MAQIIVNLGEQEDKFLNIFKAKKGIKSKNEAINIALKNYEQMLKKEDEDLIFENRVKEALAEYEKTPNKKKYTKEEFLKEMSKW